MALNADGFEGGVFLTLEQQAQLSAKQHEASQEQPESTVPAKRKRKTGAKARLRVLVKAAHVARCVKNGDNPQKRANKCKYH